MMRAQQYEASLRRLSLVVYLFGRRIENVVAHPIIRPSMNAGAGSPQAQRTMISCLVDLKGKQRKARRLCGIITDGGSVNA
jgi:aromatic ring hydroxylase